MKKYFFLTVAVTLTFICPLTAQPDAPHLICERTCTELKLAIEGIGDSAKHQIELFDTIRLNFDFADLQRRKDIYDSEVLSYAKCISDDTNSIQIALDRLYTEVTNDMLESDKYLMVVGGASFTQILAWERYREKVPGLIEFLCNLKENPIQRHE